MAAAKKILPYGYLTEAKPGPVFVGVDQPMKVYTCDNMLFTNAKVKDDVVYKIIDTLEKNKAELSRCSRRCATSPPPRSTSNYDIPYHPGALKYFKDQNIQAKAFQ